MNNNSLLAQLGISTLIISTIGIVGLPKQNYLQAQNVNPPNTSVEDIAEEDVNMFGQEVTVRGEVTDVEPGMSFTLTEEGFFAGDQVLVINVSGEMIPETPEEPVEIQVTGTLQRLVVADVEQQYDLDLTSQYYGRYEDTPVILAESIALSPNVGDISENPEYYYNKVVAVQAEVEEIINPMVFTLDEDQLFGGQDLLVLNVNGQPMPTNTDDLVVTGTVRPFVRSEIERDYDLTWDLDLVSQLEAEYSERPVLIVDDIYPAIED